MPFFITDQCVGCTVCANKCPTNAITGEKKGRHWIDPDLCIDCGVCALWCPYPSITNNRGELVIGVKAKEVPKAVVDIDHCTGCVMCIGACPFDAIEIMDHPDGDWFYKVVTVIDKKCTGCRLCEEICIKKCIVVPGVEELLEDRVAPKPELEAAVPA